MQQEINARLIAEFVGGRLAGNPETPVKGVSKIDQSEADTLSFLANPKYESFLQDTRASVVLVNENQVVPPSQTTTYIFTEDAYLSFCKILNQFFNPSRNRKGISAFAVIEPDAVMEEDVYLGPNVYVGAGVKIGKGTAIYANTSIGDSCSIGENCLIFSGVNIYDGSVIGNHCIIHSGTVIGCDGFGHAPQKDGSYVKIPQIGNVVIEDNVEIGSNCSIDRATMGSTIIRTGVRLDNLIQIAHNVEIDAHTVIAAQSGIAGSTYIGKHCVIAGQVGIVGHLKIADRTMIGAQSGLNHNVETPGTQLTDSPAFALRDAFKSRVLYRKLPEMNQRLNELERQLRDIKNSRT